MESGTAWMLTGLNPASTDALFGSSPTEQSY